MGAWIEIIVTMPLLNNALVAPLVGAWIEINVSLVAYVSILSLLSWERGLKFSAISSKLVLVLSLLSWERGLKFVYLVPFSVLNSVAPLVGAWIEINIIRLFSPFTDRRSSRGSVD